MMLPIFYGNVPAAVNVPSPARSFRTVITQYCNGTVTIDVEPVANGYFPGFFGGPPSGIAQQMYPRVDGLRPAFYGAGFVKPCVSPSEYVLPEMRDKKKATAGRQRSSPSPHKLHLQVPPAGDKAAQQTTSRTRDSPGQQLSSASGHQLSDEVFEVKSVYAMDHMEEYLEGSAQLERLPQMRVAAALDDAIYLDPFAARLPPPFDDLPNLPENQMHFFGKLFAPATTSIVNAGSENGQQVQGQEVDDLD